MHGIDIKEDYLRGLGNGILDKLLLDRTTGENIIWATDDYASMGDAYTFFKHITPELITGEHKNVIQPRVAKSEEERKLRARKMAEVFTPSWICNNMNNGVDERWFKRTPVFNVAFTEGGKHSWTPTTDKILFPEGKTWQEYVSMGVIEITSLSYIRGRSLRNTFLIVDEAQNLTRLQAKTIATRIGQGSKLIICGDPNQIDNPKLDKKNNGLIYLSEKFKGSALCAQVEFLNSECVRSKLAIEAINRL
jgi:hypothetical protein